VIWFTSDLHLGHEKVAKLRGFQDTIDHDEALAWNWTDQVKNGDQVWVLGDVAVSNPAYALDLLASLPGDKHIVWGNHDKGHPMHRDAHRKAAQYTQLRANGRAAFQSAQAFARRRVNGQSVLLSHFPYDGEGDRPIADRHVQYRLRDEGVPLIHGHVHSSRAVTCSLEMWSTQIHVGLDAWDMRLVSLAQVEALLA
jgi:calcineurin-like phosphoesterase family protein